MLTVTQCLFEQADTMAQGAVVLKLLPLEDTEMYCI